jgi:hypothetical protein
MRRLGSLIRRSARSKKLAVLDESDRSPGVFGTVACAAAPRAALNGVAGTGVPYPPEPWEPKLEVDEGKAFEIAGSVVLIGLGKDGPLIEFMVVDLVKKRGAWVRDVMDDKLGGPIDPRLFDVRWDQGESLMARLASLTVLWSGFMSCLTSGLRSLWSFPGPVYAVASSPQA